MIPDATLLALLAHAEMTSDVRLRYSALTALGIRDSTDTEQRQARQSCVDRLEMMRLMGESMRTTTEAA